jgi:hypothetical protein
MISSGKYFRDIQAYFSVCQMIAVLPATSVNCERGFSNLARVKTNNRNRLKEEHLESVMRIASTEMDELTMLGRSNKFIKAWKGEKDRRMAGKADTLRL